MMMEVGHAAINQDGPSDVFDREVVAADLVGQDSEQMIGVGVIGLPQEDLAVELLSGGELAALVMLERQG